MKAIENRAQISRVAAIWERKFKYGAQVIGRRSAPVLWHEHCRVWGAFIPESERSWRPGAYWNTFGNTLGNFKHNTIVHINPPTEGQNGNLQGLFAVDEFGSRWVLHQGRLHPAQTRISQDMFERVSGAESFAEVSFRSGNTARYFAVANIDLDPPEVQRQISDFVDLCERVRIHYTEGPSSAADLAMVREAEFKLFLEAQGKTVIQARNASEGYRWHADIFKELTEKLKRRGLILGSARIGKHGPDLYTNCNVPKLFEIKSGGEASDIQTGLGQLLLYEKLLGRYHRKILVLPTGRDGALEKLLSEFDVEILRFSKVGGRFRFSPADLNKIVESNL